ncbi:MAG: disulfide oxidoreductase [Caldilineaceae bacterium]
MDRFSALLERSSLYIALLAAWIAMCGSLYFSEVAGYIPCTFCWYQRILMYPLTLVIAIGLLRRDPHLPLYVLPFSILGIGVSTYHYLLQKTTLFSELSTCQMGVPCSGIWINWLGFITIPFLALTAFFIITMMTVIALQAGEPSAPWTEDDEALASSGRPWIPVVSIIAIVVIAFVVLGQMNSNSSAAHAALDLPVIAVGAQTALDGTVLNQEATADLTAGAARYAESCAPCHGADAQGIDGLGTDLRTSALVRDESEGDLLAMIRNGLTAEHLENKSGIAMPPSGGRPDLSDDDILSIIRYLRSGT